MQLLILNVICAPPDMEIGNCFHYIMCNCDLCSCEKAITVLRMLVTDRVLMQNLFKS